MTSDPESPKSSDKSTSFWAELKRRKVMRVAFTYAVVAWLIMQVAGLTFEGFGVPIWAFRFVVIVLWLFFPVAVILTWAFELTPEGIKTTKNARESQSEEPVSKTYLRKRNWMALGFAAALPTVVFGALALYFYATRDSVGDVVEKSIAVLPLENISPDPENAFFADGVHVEILDNLSEVGELRVIARNSTLRYRDIVKSNKEIGAELGARYLVAGSVRRAEDQVLVDVELIDSSTEERIWSGKYDRVLDEIFTIQASIAQEIAKTLQAVITPEEKEKIEYRPTENLEAYDYYVQGRSLVDTLEGSKIAFDYYQKALEIDPNFALAYAGISAHYFMLVTWYQSSPREAYPKAVEWFNIAKEMQPDLSETVEMSFRLTLFHKWDVHTAQQILNRMYSLHPNQPKTHNSRSYFYAAVGNHEKSIEAAIRMRDLNPFNSQYHLYLSHMYYLAGRYGEALEIARRVLADNPGDMEAHRRLAFANSALGNYEEAVASLEKVNKMLDEGVWTSMEVATAYANAGREKEAREILDTVLEADYDFYIPKLLFVYFYAALDEADQAFHWMEKAFEERDYWLIMIQVEPRLDPLRADPRFQSFVNRIDFPG